MLSLNPMPADTRKYFSRPPLLRGPADHPAAGPSAAERVQEMAAKMGGARRGPRGTTVIVDVLIGLPAGDVEASGIPRILGGIHERAELEIRERHELERIRIAVHHHAPGGLRPLFRPDRAGDRHGAILVHRFELSDAELVARRTMAVAVLGGCGRLGIDAIDTDDEGAISSLVGRLRAAGHTRIGFVSWDDPAGGRAGRRFRGYASGLSARGLRLHRDWILDAPQAGPRELAGAAARRTRDSGVTAWVCASDRQADILARGLPALGIRVPQDCSITGFGGLEPPAGVPRVTTMRVPHEHIGSCALTRMINRVMYPSSPRRMISVEAQLVAGETIAAPSGP